MRVLVADDDDAIRRLLVRVLSAGGYEPHEAADGDEVVAALEGGDFPLVLCDIEMPGVSGLELLERVDGDSRTAMVMVTGKDDTEVAMRALERGAYGYVTKPFAANEILINVANALRRLGLEQEAASQRQRLEVMVRERTAELWKAVRDLEHAYQDLSRSRTETVERLSLAAEFRDDETARHLQRMSRYCELLALRCGFDAQDAEQLRVAAVMHDVGKIGIPDGILLKAGPLTATERTTMQGHAEIGYRILTGSSADVLRLGASIAYTHHEWWDGRGYPRGLRGEEIPIEGRIAAIADVFDAVTTDRVYRKALPFGAALDTMRQGRGTQFEPGLLDDFLDPLDEVLAIQARFVDRR